MTRPMSRRFADAFCAFVHGHSRRDLDRTKIARVRCLTLRGIARRKAREARWREFGLDDLPMYREFSSQALENRLGEMAKSVNGPIYAALVRQVEIDRGSLHLARKDLWIRDEVSRAGLDGCHYDFEPSSVGGGKLYGKLYEGLLNCGPLHLFDHQISFGTGYWHSVFSRLKAAIRTAIGRCAQ